MTTKPKVSILRLARRRRRIVSADVVRDLGVSRQTAAQHLRELVADGRLVKSGSTRAAAYRLASPRDRAAPAGLRVSKRYSTAGLSEDRVFREMAMQLNLKKRLSAPAYGIVDFVFTEMLNNAIEHSKASGVDIVMRMARGEIEFEVIDRGIGAFETLRRKFRLKDHFESLEHLMKGKQTVDPAHHTGQGIFFTSKIADKFVLESARIRWIVDDVRRDTFLEDIRSVRGTRVTFRLKQRSRKDLKRLFQDYTNDDFEFDRTRMLIRLSKPEGEHVSRSEARRLLFGLDAFRRITLDFEGVRAIGQAFADEIFRVFQTAHPEIRIDPVNMSPAVEFMIRRARPSSV